MTNVRSLINFLKKRWQVVEDYLAGAEISIEGLEDLLLL